MYTDKIGAFERLWEINFKIKSIHKTFKTSAAYYFANQDDRVYSPNSNICMLRQNYLAGITRSRIFPLTKAFIKSVKPLTLTHNVIT